MERRAYSQPLQDQPERTDDGTVSKVCQPHGEAISIMVLTSAHARSRLSSPGSHAVISWEEVRDLKEINGIWHFISVLDEGVEPLATSTKKGQRIASAQSSVRTARSCSSPRLPSAICVCVC